MPIHFQRKIQIAPRDALRKILHPAKGPYNHALQIEKVPRADSALQEHQRQDSQYGNLLFPAENPDIVVVYNDFAHSRTVNFNVQNRIFMADCVVYGLTQSFSGSIENPPLPVGHHIVKRGEVAVLFKRVPVLLHCFYYFIDRHPLLRPFFPGKRKPCKSRKFRKKQEQKRSEKILFHAFFPVNR